MPEYPIPPRFGDFAPVTDSPRRATEVEPSGPLAAHRAPRPLSARSIWLASYQCDSPEKRPLADAVRAWQIPCLVGRRIDSAHSDALPTAIRDCLAEALPNVDWPIVDYTRIGKGLHDGHGHTPDLVAAKYGFLHTLVPTPPDDATGEPMILELYGPIVEIDGVEPGSQRTSARMSCRLPRREAVRAQSALHRERQFDSDRTRNLGQHPLDERRHSILLVSLTPALHRAIQPCTSPKYSTK